MTIEIRKLSDIPKDESITLLLFGNIGTGKTEFCGTAGSRTLFINTGNGILTLQSPGFKKRWPNVDPIVIDVSLDQQVSYNELMKVLDDKFKNELDTFDTVVLDDATGLRHLAMTLGVEINSTYGKSKTQELSRKRGGVLSPDVSDYGEEMNIIQHFVSSVVDDCKKNKKHFIMTAHVREIYGKAAKIGDEPPLKKVRPGFTGQKFPDTIAAMFDFVWFVELVNGKRRFRTKPDQMYTAKTRWDGVFEEKEENLNFPEVLRRIRGS